MRVKAAAYVLPHLSSLFTQFVPRQQPKRGELINTLALIVVEIAPSGL